MFFGYETKFKAVAAFGSGLLLEQPQKRLLLRCAFRDRQCTGDTIDKDGARTFTYSDGTKDGGRVVVKVSTRYKGHEVAWFEDEC